METAYNIGKVITIILVLSVSIYFFIIIRKSQVTESELIGNNKAVITGDLKVYSIVSSGFIDRGNEYSYCRFKINEDKSVSLYFRFSLPAGVYYGPFLLVSKNSASAKQLTYYVEKFEREKDGKCFLHFRTRPSIISTYRVYIEYIDEEGFIQLSKLFK